MKSVQLWPDNPFWEFSIDFYSREGVAVRLIALQEELQIDVNLMLYCYWMAYIGRPTLSKSEIQRKAILVLDWQTDVVIPLRRVRSSLKDNNVFKKLSCSNEVRIKVKAAELEAERVEQLILYENDFPTVDQDIGMSEKRERAIANVGLYFSFMGKKPNINSQIILDQLLERLFTSH